MNEVSHRTPPSVPSEEEDSILRAQPSASGNLVCGLVGELRFDGDYADIAAVDRISAVLSPRGPDGCGVWCRGPVAFGHRRVDHRPERGWVAADGGLQSSG